MNPPKYVLSISSYQESLAKYEIWVKKVQNKAVRDKAEKYLEALRRALDKYLLVSDIQAHGNKIHMILKENDRMNDTNWCGNEQITFT